jgi:hypothetical protein
LQEEVKYEKNSTAISNDLGMYECNMVNCRLHLTDAERAVIDRSLANFSGLSESDKDQLMSIFGMCGTTVNPRSSTIKKHILAMARNELIFKPSPFIDMMKSGLPELHVDIFWSKLTLPAIEKFYKNQMPTAARVSEVLTIDETVVAPRQEQLNCFYYLKQFVLSLDSDDLAAFLQFVTGSVTMPDGMFVRFSSLTGLQRRPVVHTCSSTIELPDSYACYQDLKREFRTVLSNCECFNMNMA